MRPVSATNIHSKSYQNKLPDIYASVWVSRGEDYYIFWHTSKVNGDDATSTVRDKRTVQLCALKATPVSIRSDARLCLVLRDPRF